MECDPAGGGISQQRPSQSNESLGQTVGQLIVEQGLGLQEIVVINNDIKELQLALKERVQTLNAQGVSWKLIGAALGVTPQSAHQRFRQKP